MIMKTLPKYVTADISPKPTVDMVTCQSIEISVSQYYIKQFTTAIDIHVNALSIGYIYYIQCSNYVNYTP